MRAWPSSAAPRQGRSWSRPVAQARDATSSRCQSRSILVPASCASVVPRCSPLVAHVDADPCTSPITGRPSLCRSRSAELLQRMANNPVPAAPPPTYERHHGPGYCCNNLPGFHISSLSGCSPYMPDALAQPLIFKGYSNAPVQRLSTRRRRASGATLCTGSRSTATLGGCLSSRWRALPVMVSSLTVPVVGGPANAERLPRCGFLDAARPTLRTRLACPRRLYLPELLPVVLL